MQQETPSIQSYATQARAYGVGAFNQLNNFHGAGQLERRILQAAGPGNFFQTAAATPQEKPMANGNRRLVQVFIADPDENVPMEDCLLYRGEQKLTDLTDQELFFEVDIKSILDKHNEKRIKLVNKKVKERVEHLEPAKIRDLKMVVVNVAQF